MAHNIFASTIPAAPSSASALSFGEPDAASLLSPDAAATWRIDRIDVHRDVGRGTPWSAIVARVVATDGRTEVEGGTTPLTIFAVWILDVRDGAAVWLNAGVAHSDAAAREHVAHACRNDRLERPELFTELERILAASARPTPHDAARLAALERARAALEPGARIEVYGARAVAGGSHATIIDADGTAVELERRRDRRTGDPSGPWVVIGFRSTGARRRHDAAVRILVDSDR